MWMPLTSPYSLHPPHNITAIGTFIAASVMTSCSHEVMTEVTQNCSELWGIYRSKTYINMDDLKLFTEAPEVMMQQYQVRFFLLMLWNLPNLGPTKIRNCFISFHPSLRHRLSEVKKYLVFKSALIITTKPKRNTFWPCLWPLEPPKSLGTKMNCAKVSLYSLRVIRKGCQTALEICIDTFSR